MCDLIQLVFNSNLGRTSLGFGSTVTYWSKIASGTRPL